MTGEGLRAEKRAEGEGKERRRGKKGRGPGEGPREWRLFFVGIGEVDGLSGGVVGKESEK